MTPELASACIPLLRWLDPETALFYYRAQYYDAGLGRFVGRDPISFAGGINLYGYVGDSPLTRTDALGLLAPLPVLVPAAAPAATTSVAVAGAAVTCTAAVSVGVGYGIGEYVVRPICYDPFFRWWYKNPVDVQVGEDCKVKDCYCMCLRPDPNKPGTNVGPNPMGRMSRTDCKRIPHRPGSLYSYCYCKGD